MSRIRPATVVDAPRTGELAHALWPDGSVAEHGEHAAAGSIVGFIEVGLRSHADGRDATRAVAFVEGWYVEPRLQRRAIGRALMAAAETWSREHGARELGSDTWLDNEGSQRAHEALGFEVVDRCVHYRKPL